MSEQNSSSATSEQTSHAAELKAGHAPAIKVGGMRVSAPRPRHTSQGEEKDKPSNAENDKAENETQEKGDSENVQETNSREETTNEVANRAEGEMVSGTFVPVQKAFPPEAVKHIHDKPGTHPKNEYHAHVKRDDHTLHQPRK